MPTVFIYHEVKDKDHWLSSPKREEVLGPLGVTNIRLFVDPENPTRVGGMMDVPMMPQVVEDTVYEPPSMVPAAAIVAV